MSDTAPSGSYRAALARGRAALQAQDRAEALRWLDRAHRLSPKDSAGAFLLASVLTGTDDARAERMLQSLIDAQPRFWAAHIALIALTFRLGKHSQAAALLHHLLANAAPPTDAAFLTLADQVARRAGRPGWVGMDSGGKVTIRAASPATLGLDGKTLRASAKGPFTLPSGWRASSTLTASAGDAPLLGSPLTIRAHIQVEGFVSTADNGDLVGWAWLPGDPDAEARLTLHTTKPVGIVADDLAFVPAQGDGVSRPRGFRVPARRLGRAGVIRLTGPDGADLFGSPITRAAPPPKRSTTPARAAIDIVIPVYRGAADFTACLASIRRSLPAGARVVAVDDASPDPALRAALVEAAQQGVIVLRHAHNRGFPAAANTGLRHAAGRDVVLLNPDTLVPRHWLKHLAEAAYSAPDIGSVTPMTNDGTIVSYPTPGETSPPPDLAETDRLHKLARTANAGRVENLPTAVGFCMFIRHDCLAAIGLLREDVFAQGYGEENDWCCRAAALGWRHVADTASFITHSGGRSFGGMKAALLDRNLAILNRLHPGYAEDVADFMARDPLAGARRRIDALRWRQGARPKGAVILVSHDLGGGVARHIAERATALRAQGLRPILLAPAGPWPPADEAAPRLAVLSDGPETPFPNLRFDPATDLPALAALLRADKPAWVELHHMVGHDPHITRLATALGIPYDLVLHDYALICPRITLCGTTRMYCGEPVDSRDCDACVADNGDRLHTKMTVAALRAGSAALVAGARQVIAPTQDAAARLLRYVAPRRMEVRGWEPAPGALPARPRRLAGQPVTVAILGAIGEEKGLSVLLACARDAARRDLALRFVIVGHSSDDTRLLDTGRIHITGEYEQDEAETLLRAQNAQLGFLPSVWPETWCYTLSSLWAAGLWPVAFELGAQAERISRCGCGTLLPLGFPAARINDLMLELTHG